MTIFGTRPEIIRLSLVMKVLDQHCDHVTVHTGQNYHESLSDIFIRDLGVRTRTNISVSGRRHLPNRSDRSCQSVMRRSSGTRRIAF